MPHVFTYGTLMFPEIWQSVVGQSFANVPATLADHEIFRVKDAVYPGIIMLRLPPSPLSLPPSTPVPGILYLDVDDEAIARLDRFEGDFYERRSITVAGEDGRHFTADAYIVPDASRHLLTGEPWTAAEFAARGDLERFIARYAGFDRLG